MYLFVILSIIEVNYSGHRDYSLNLLQAALFLFTYKPLPLLAVISIDCLR